MSILWKTRVIGIVFVVLSFLFTSTLVFAQTTAPGTPSNVLVSYPACEGENCNFSQAKCTWGSATGAATYTVVITEVDTNTVIQNQSVSSSTLTFTFAVSSGRTYKCDVTAVNSSGSSGATGSHSLLCQTDEVSAPTPIPTTPPIGAPLPPPPSAGNEFIFMSLGLMGAAVMLIGATVLFIL